MSGKQTSFDKAITWCKNNRFFASVLLLVTAIVGTAALLQSIDTIRTTSTKLFERGESPQNHLNSIDSPGTPTPSISPEINQRLGLEYASIHGDLPPEPLLRYSPLPSELVQSMDYYPRSLHFIVDGDYAAARRELTSALESEAGDKLRAYRALGRLEIYAGQYREGIQWLERAAILSSHAEREVRELGYAYLYAGNVDKALDRAEELIARRRGEAPPIQRGEVARNYRLKASALYLKGSLEEAEWAARVALANLNLSRDTQVPDKLRILSILGLINTDLDSLKVAEMTFSEALPLAESTEALDPAILGELLNNFGLLRKRQGVTPSPSIAAAAWVRTSWR